MEDILYRIANKKYLPVYFPNQIGYYFGKFYLFYKLPLQNSLLFSRCLENRDFVTPALNKSILLLNIPLFLKENQLISHGFKIRTEKAIYNFYLTRIAQSSSVSSNMNFPQTESLTMKCLQSQR